MSGADHTSMSASLLDDLARVVGTGNVLRGDDPSADLSAWEQDWRGRARGRALAVVRPGTTEEVAQVVKLCALAQTAIVPQGGNTGLVEGSIPDPSGTQVVLSLSRMCAIRQIDEANLTVTVEAGCVLQTLQETVADAGYFFPLSLAAKGTCTIGGNLATNAGGTQVLRYGNARNLCLGLEVVTSRGEVWSGLSGLRKNNTGYDLRDLFIGSEGTLGIITAATMQMVPQPSAQLTAWVAVPSASHALDLLALARRGLSAGLTGFELVGRFAVSMVHRHLPQLRVPLYAGDSPYFVLIELSDPKAESQARGRLEELLGEAIESGCATDAVIAESLAQAAELWEIRESIPLAAIKEGFMAAHDISVPISVIPHFIGEAEAQLSRHFPGMRISNFGHLGDGNLHYNVHAPADADPLEFLRQHEEDIREVVYDTVHRFDGSFSAEHGVGSLKLEKMKAYKCAVELDLMRAIKHALDPAMTLNPGRVLYRS